MVLPLLLPVALHLQEHEGGSPGDQHQACECLKPRSKSQMPHRLDITKPEGRVGGKGKVSAIDQGTVKITLQGIEMFRVHHVKVTQGKEPDLYYMGDQGPEYTDQDCGAAVQGHFLAKDKQVIERLVMDNHHGGDQKAIQDKGVQHFSGVREKNPEPWPRLPLP